MPDFLPGRGRVVPLAGTWIEIPGYDLCSDGPGMSFPSRERGLKYDLMANDDKNTNVVPLAGTWIEIHEARQGGK